MPRKGFVTRREVPPDSVFGSDLVQKFINSMMWDGKRSNAQRIFYGAMDQIAAKTSDDPLKTFKKAVDNVKPVLEVKTRRAGGPGSGEEAVDARKRLRLVRGAAAWLHEQPQRLRRARFDVVVCECSRDERAWRLRHLEGAFDAEA